MVDADEILAIIPCGDPTSEDEQSKILTVLNSLKNNDVVVHVTPHKDGMAVILGPHKSWIQ